MSKKSVLWLGYGDIASRCTPLLLDANFEVFAACRSPKNIDKKANLMLGDLRDHTFVAEMLAHDPDYIVMTITPDQRGEEGYRNSYFSVSDTVLTQLRKKSVQPQHIIFVSSTSVYHQDDGSWVDEDSPTQPQRETSQVLLETENALSDSEFSNTNLRFSGIYGADRNFLLRQVRDGKGGNDAWTNRIHVEDCARVIAFLIKQKSADVTLPKTILASDSDPARSSEVREWLAEQMGLPKNSLRSEATEKKNKRCNNQVLRELGYEFLYPSFRDAYPQQIRRFMEQNQSQQQ